jgi:hypothetical protein
MARTRKQRSRTSNKKKETRRRGGVRHIPRPLARPPVPGPELRTPPRIFDDVNSREQMNQLKDTLSTRPENWLVLYAKFGNPAERARFQDPKWVFCDNEDFQHRLNIEVHQRLLIKTNLELDGKINLTTMLTALPGTFDYITIDETATTAFDSIDRLSLFVNALHLGGIVALHYHNVDFNIFDHLPDHLRDKINYEIIPAFTPSYAGCVPYNQQFMGFNAYTREELITNYVSRMNEILTDMEQPLIDTRLELLALRASIREKTALIASRWRKPTVTPGTQNAGTAEDHATYGQHQEMYNFVLKRVA